MAVSTLDSAGVLRRYAELLQKLPDATSLAALLGVSSAVVDNVPLVQAGCPPGAHRVSTLDRPPSRCLKSPWTRRYGN